MESLHRCRARVTAERMSELLTACVSTLRLITESCSIQRRGTRANVVRAGRDHRLQAMARSARTPDCPAKGLDEAVRRTHILELFSVANPCSAFAIRLRGCQPDVEVWQRILQVRTLVLSPVEATDMWIKFVNLCRKSERLDLAAKTLNSLLGSSSLGTDVEGGRAPPNILYAYYKFTWAKGDRVESLQWLREFTANLVRDVQLTQVNGRLVAAHPSNAAYTELLARCHVKLGKWQVALQEGWFAVRQTSIRQGRPSC